MHDVKNANQPACWWPDSPQTSAQRPLAGLKVVDLTRVIAAPALTRGLAELGASVTAEHITDMSALHVNLNWGKWKAHLDSREAADRKKLRALGRDVDIVVQEYRPGVLDKYGFSPDGLLENTKDWERSLIVVRENYCYGWNGPWSYRSGWQQISDACCGVSMEFSRAMANNGLITPVFSNSDFCTGTSGVVYRNHKTEKLLLYEVHRIWQSANFPPRARYGDHRLIVSHLEPTLDKTLMEMRGSKDEYFEA